MQIDMHYYCTYTLARAAGIERTTAETIATASQFVNDNISPSSISFPDGGKMTTFASGHHWQRTENTSADDQRTIWIPFHFLPGGEGDTFEEKARCTKHSPVVQEMVANHLSLAHKKYAPQLIGIAAHVLADTFSHQDFSGLSSIQNQIEASNIEILEPTPEQYSVQNEYDSFLGRFARESEDGDGTVLGHGSAAIFPDLPYLTWTYKKAGEAQKTVRRYNQEDFMEAAESLYSLFVQFAEERPDLSDTAPTPFSNFQSSLAIILATPGDKHQRSGLWQIAMAQGAILDGRHEEIPPYKGEMWKSRHEELATCPECALVTEREIFKFHQAAATHRAYILYDLLPAHDLLVS